jgi:hypothetical protein
MTMATLWVSLNPEIFAHNHGSITIDTLQHKTIYLDCTLAYQTAHIICNVAVQYGYGTHSRTGGANVLYS